MARVREARAHTGLRICDFAVLMGVADRTVQRWETGQQAPELAMLCRMASLCGVSVTWLIQDVDEARHVIGSAIHPTNSTSTSERAYPPT